MQLRTQVPVWVVVLMVVSLARWGVTEDALPLKTECRTTLVTITLFCRIEVHHTGMLPRRYSTEADKEQLKRQLCPCKDFEVQGLICPRFIYNLAKKYSPDIMCVGFRN